MPPIHSSSSMQYVEIDQEEWQCVDAHVIQQINGTISHKLMQTIFDTSGAATAHKTWEAIHEIFQDIRNTHALYLEDQFTHAEMETLSNISSYGLQS